MNRLSIYNLAVCFCLTLGVTSASGRAIAYSLPTDKDTSRPDAIQFTPIIVNGRALTGPNSSAHRRDARILIPVTAVARALGDVIGVEPATRNVTVRRQTGLSAEFDARIGHVRENGAPILTVSNAGEIVLSPNADELMLPIEIAAALFHVSIRYDGGSNTVIINRGQARTEIAASKNGRRVADIYQVDYDYSLNRYGSGGSQNLTVTALGRLADGRFNFSSNSSSSSPMGLSIRNASFSLERPNGQRYGAGDFGTGTNLQFLLANVRGGSASIPAGETIFTAFGGRSFSGVVTPVTDPLPQNIPVLPVRDRFRYDTNIFGFFAATNSGLFGRKPDPLTLSAGAMRFTGGQRSGDLVSGSVNYGVRRFRLQGDFGYGKFAGLRLDNSRFRGHGAAVDIAGMFQVSGSLALQARYAHIGSNFLSPQSGFREPIDLRAAGVTWSPKKWLSTSFNASSSHRSDSGQNNNFLTAAFAITPDAGLPRLYVSHTESSTSQTRSAAFTLVNASKEFARLRLFLNATRIKNTGPAAMNAQLGASYTINDHTALEFSQGIGSRGALNGQVDWRSSNLLNHRLSLSAGIGYNRGTTSGVSIYERLSASLILPRQTSLQVNYFHTNAGATVLVSLRGSLFRRREAIGFLDSPVSEMNSYGKVSGRVYQDIDQNGRFDPGVDKPQADVKVRVDGNRYVVSDENGLYQFDSVAAGDHKIYLDLLSVRADLTLLGDAAQAARLLPGTSSVYDFRLVRTGRISGRVWLDLNENGKLDEGERPLADIRVVTASGRDTLTDSEGNFTIGDLPPGEHIVLIDEKTLPDKTMAGSKPIAVQVFAGRETTDVSLRVMMIPAEVKHFTAQSPGRE